MDSFSIGDTVTWTHVCSRGNSASFTTRKGKVIELTENNVLAKMKNGHKYMLSRHRVRLEGERTELTQMVEEFKP